MSNADDSKSELEAWIDTWLNRAAAAYKHGNLELSKQALHKRWEYQKRLAEMETKETPEEPKDPELFFAGWTSVRMTHSATLAFPIQELVAHAFGFGKKPGQPGALSDHEKKIFLTDSMLQSVRKEVENLRQPGETDEQFVRKLMLFYKRSRRHDENQS